MYKYVYLYEVPYDVFKKRKSNEEYRNVYY